MSFYPRRSILSVPGHITKMHLKGAESAADVIMFDLEDSVPVQEKSTARTHVVNSLQNLDFGNKAVSVRVNGLDTPWFYDDIISVCEAAGENLHTLVIPKVNNAGDVYFYDRLLTGIEEKSGIKNRIGLEVSIESAEGLNNIFDISNASGRIVSIVFGIADFSTSIGSRLVSLSGHGENEENIYPGNRWGYVLSRIASAAKGKGLVAIDAPYGNFRDDTGLAKSCQISIALGFDGKWAIHPAQIETINKLFSPDTEEINFAKKIVEAEKSAIEHGLGAVAIDGRMIDRATIRFAKRRLEMAEKISGF